MPADSTYEHPNLEYCPNLSFVLAAQGLRMMILQLTSDHGADSNVHEAVAFQEIVEEDEWLVRIPRCIFQVSIDLRDIRSAGFLWKSFKDRSIGRILKCGSCTIDSGAARDRDPVFAVASQIRDT